jgi:hypothetical protein
LDASFPPLIRLVLRGNEQRSGVVPSWSVTVTLATALERDEAEHICFAHRASKLTRLFLFVSHAYRILLVRIHSLLLALRGTRSFSPLSSDARIHRLMSSRDPVVRSRSPHRRLLFVSLFLLQSCWQCHRDRLSGWYVLDRHRRFGRVDVYLVSVWYLQLVDRRALRLRLSHLHGRSVTERQATIGASRLSEEAMNRSSTLRPKIVKLRLMFELRALLCVFLRLLLPDEVYRRDSLPGWCLLPARLVGSDSVLGRLRLDGAGTAGDHHVSSLPGWSVTLNAR